MKRRRSGEAAIDQLGPDLNRYGITRVAEQTGLDKIGIPCWAAVRPNSRTLAVNQGKGLDDAVAQVSAAMEAIEFAVAETPPARRWKGSINELSADGRAYFVPFGSLPVGFKVDPTTQITWLEGRDLATREPIFVPLDSVALAPNAEERLPFAQSSNGLAAGFLSSEAMAHAVCELIERDASALWSLQSPHRRAATAVDLGAGTHARLSMVANRVTGAGLGLKLFDVTSDLGIPVVMACIFSKEPRLFFDVASGVCAHPNAEDAAVGAITEAAQTRISNISGSRDDISPADYGRPLPTWLGELVLSTSATTRSLPISLSDAAFDSRLTWIASRSKAIVVPLLEGDDISVVKVLSDFLEDRTTNVHWRPGQRAIRAITKQ